MNSDTKKCNRCGLVKSRSADFSKKAGICKECNAKRMREYLARLKEEGKYWDYVQRHQAARNEAKELHRRKVGCRLRSEMKEEAAIKHTQRLEAAALRAALKAAFKAAFVGPPTPASALSKADYHRWRYLNQPEYRDYHKAKRARNVQEVTFCYAKERLGVRNAPSELIEAKRIFMLITKELRNAKHC